MMNQFDLGANMRPLYKPGYRPAVFLQWWQRNAFRFSPEMQKAVAPEIAKLQKAHAQGVAGLGDFWSELRDKLIDKASGTVKDVAAKFSENAPQVARAAAEYKLMTENIKRINAGQQPINASEVTGFGDIKTLLYVGIGAFVLVKFLGRKK